MDNKCTSYERHASIARYQGYSWLRHAQGGHPSCLLHPLTGPTSGSQTIPMSTSQKWSTSWSLTSTAAAVETPRLTRLGPPPAVSKSTTESDTRGRRADWTNFPTAPTSQRAEITAIILALEWALERYDGLGGSPRLAVTIRSDSRYAVECMTNWVYNWVRNGWTNSRGFEVANRDLIERASDLDDRVAELGSVDYIWIPRSENRSADALCQQELDEQESSYMF